MARFFIDNPIVAMVISIVTILLGVVAMSGSAHRTVPRDRAADGPGHDDVHRRQRDGRRSVRRDAARTEDQRRRELDLHEVDERQRRHADAEGQLRRRHEPRHGERPHAEQGVGGDAAVAAVGQELRRGREEGAGVPADGHLASSRPTGPTTTTSCRTTRRSTSTTTSRASRAWARSTCSAAATTRCACGSGRTESPGWASRCRTSPTRSSSRTSCRRPARSAGPRRPPAPNTPTPCARRGAS